MHLLNRIKGQTFIEIAIALATNGKHAGIKRGDRMRCKKKFKRIKNVV